jgi:hypothetical protein
MTTNGILGIIGCPILEDEIVYVVKADRELSEVYVVENEDSRNLVRKLRERVPDTKTTLIELKDLPTLRSDGFSIAILMKPMALHEDPKKLLAEVEKAIATIAPNCRSVLLFYGLCGNAFKNMPSKCAERPLTMLTDQQGRPVDDCIATVLGGTDGYYKLLKRYPGVFYLTPAWAENWRDLINKMEMTRGIEKGDLSMLKWMFDSAGYKKALKIQTGLADEVEFERQVQDFIHVFNFEKLELEKEWITLDAVDRAYENAKGRMNE